MDGTQFQHEVIDRLARIETSLGPVSSRLDSLEHDVRDVEEDIRGIEKNHSYVIGAFAFASGVLSLAVFAGVVGHWLGWPG